MLCSFLLVCEINASLLLFQEVLEENYLFGSLRCLHLLQQAPELGVFRSKQWVSKSSVWNAEQTELNSHPLLILIEEWPAVFSMQNCIYQSNLVPSRGAPVERDPQLSSDECYSLTVASNIWSHCRSDAVLPTLCHNHHVLEQGGKPNRNVSFLLSVIAVASLSKYWEKPHTSACLNGDQSLMSSWLNSVNK